MLRVDPDYWRGRRVFLTGHTGFKGAWLAFWLSEMGAEVTGYALPPVGKPALFDLLGLPQGHFADIRDAATLATAVEAAQPEVVFHLAAQAIVRASFDDPVGTFATNVTGTAALLDAVRRVDSVRAVVAVTSDKCYENREWEWGYRETDPMGGHDPYSASKGAAELVVASMRRSYFAPGKPGGHPARIVSVRAGNVIGGGDWSADRLVPDIARAVADHDETVTLRNPGAIRPWQHVLEPVAAYLALAQKLDMRDDALEPAYNFGPIGDDARPVIDVAQAMIAAFGRGQIVIDSPADRPHEAHYLKLDCSRAMTSLGWKPRWGFSEAIAHTAAWYAAHASGADPIALTRQQIAAFQAADPYGASPA